MPRAELPLPERGESLRERVERQLFEQLMSLPASVQRLLAGRPVRLDGQRLAVDTQLMLRLQASPGQQRVESVSTAAGRRLMLRQARVGGGVQPIGEVRDLEVAGRPGRLYTPTAVAPGSPLLLFLHGGGFFFGDLDTHDAACRFLAERAEVRVLAVDYRLGPEDKFPAAYDDALAAFAWTLEHAEELGADPLRIGVGGDSAGGNLSAGVAHAAARAGQPLKATILLYPATDRSAETVSSELFGRGFFLTADFMALAQSHYSRTPADHVDPRYSPGLDEVPAGLAPTWVFTAGFDPLRDEGETYAERLAAAGVPVVQRRFPSQVHGFVNVLHGRSAVAANVEVAAAVRQALHA